MSAVLKDGIDMAVAIQTHPNGFVPIKYQYSYIPEKHWLHSVLQKEDLLFYSYLFVEYRDEDSWAVTDSFNRCLSSSGEWDFEPSPSNRSKEFLETHRFPFCDVFGIAGLASKPKLEALEKRFDHLNGS